MKNITHLKGFRLAAVVKPLLFQSRTRMRPGWDPVDHLDLKRKIPRPRLQKSPMSCLSCLLISTNQDEALQDENQWGQSIFFLPRLAYCTEWEPERELSLHKPDFPAVVGGRQNYFVIVLSPFTSSSNPSQALLVPLIFGSSLISIVLGPKNPLR